MNRHPTGFSILAVMGALVLPGAWALGEEELFWERDIRPIFKAHCTACHGEEESLAGGVDLRLRRFLDRNAQGIGPLLVVGQPGASEVVRVIRSGEMPKEGKKVSESDIGLIERWISAGAKHLKPEPESLAPGMHITEEDRTWWAFTPVVVSEVPKTFDEQRVRNPIDAFVLSKLEEQNLSFAPEADRRTIVRRLSLDLTGLPPQREEVDSFVADTSADAYEKLVERLLSSPAYGERWARHWLDVVGYADSNGFAEKDSLRLYAWQYRDYVTRCFNNDTPLSQFIVEQLAGDELAAATHDSTQQAVLDPAHRDQLIATGFLRMAPDGTGDEVPDINLARNQVIAEEIKVVSSALLGLTVACAQCHDHRYDPISQADYYRFRALFEPAMDWKIWRAPKEREYSLYTPEERAKAESIETQAKAIEASAQTMTKQFLDEIFEKEIVKLPEAEREPYRTARATTEKDRTEEQKTLIKKYPSALALYSLDLYDAAAQKKVTEKIGEATALRATKPLEGFVMAITELKEKIPQTSLFHRGDHDQPKQVLEPAELTVLRSPEIEPFKSAEVSSGTSGRRLAYARWLTSGNNPLVARVLVNRFWMHHFGRGIVGTPGDFGVLGERPTHPELLDWLADTFVKSGWKLKNLHRLMVSSSTYRQSSRNDMALTVDPENRLYGRFRLGRLDAESFRDAVLSASGTLNTTVGGPPVSIARDPAGRIVVGKEELDANGDVINVKSLGVDDFRRSIYLQVRRTHPVTVLDTFDAPVMTPNCEFRNKTTVATQSLLCLNDTFILENARALAGRLRKEVPGDARGQIQRAWHILFCQEATNSDITKSLLYLAEQTEAIRLKQQEIGFPKDGPPPDAHLDALASLCQIFYSSNRFLYVH